MMSALAILYLRRGSVMLYMRVLKLFSNICVNSSSSGSLIKSSAVPEIGILREGLRADVPVVPVVAPVDMVVVAPEMFVVEK